MTNFGCRNVSQPANCAWNDRFVQFYFKIFHGCRVLKLVVFVGSLLRDRFGSEQALISCRFSQFVTREYSTRPSYLLMTLFPGKRDALQLNVGLLPFCSAPAAS